MWMKLKMIIILLLLDCLFLQKKSIDMAYKQFKKKVNTMKLKPKIKKYLMNLNLRFLIESFRE